MPDEDQPMIAERTGVSLVTDPDPLANDVSPHRLRRGLVRLGGLVAIVVVVVTLAPGLGELRRRIDPTGQPTMQSGSLHCRQEVATRKWSKRRPSRSSRVTPS